MYAIRSYYGNLERMFDVRQGVRRKDDSLPRKFFEQPLQKGPYK